MVKLYQNTKRTVEYQPEGQNLVLEVLNVLESYPLLEEEKTYTYRFNLKRLRLWVRTFNFIYPPELVKETCALLSLPYNKDEFKLAIKFVEKRNQKLKAKGLLPNAFCFFNKTPSDLTSLPFDLLKLQAPLSYIPPCLYNWENLTSVAAYTAGSVSGDYFMDSARNAFVWTAHLKEAPFLLLWHEILLKLYNSVAKEWFNTPTRTVLGRLKHFARPEAAIGPVYMGFFDFFGVRAP